MKPAKFSLDRATIIIISIASLKVLLHLYTNAFAGYGIFRDELYYIACSKRLDLGYVDHPPFSIYLLSIIRFFLGDSVFAIRLLPAFAGGALIFMTGLLTKRMGGGVFAVLISCAAVFATPLYFGMFSIYSMNTLDHLFWIFAAYLLFLLQENPKSKYWVWLGVILGLGLLNKISVLWLCAAVFTAIILTPLRTSLKTKLPYITAAIAFALFLPFIIWNITHDLAHLEFMRNASSLKYSGITRIDFLSGLILSMNPLNIIIWISGIYYFFFNADGRRYISLGFIFLIPFLILLINAHSKSEYLGPAFPVVFAGGGILLERVLKFNYVKYALPALIFLTGLLLAPFGMPILPAEKYIAYSTNLGITHSNSESKNLAELPQFYADMHGWEEMARTVSKVYTSISDEEKKSTIVFALNYGEAGAIEYYSNKYSLPPVVSPHNSYWYWGKEQLKKIKTVIVIGGNPDNHRKSCEEVIEAARVKSQYAMPYENNLPIYICRKIKRPFEEIWKSARFFI